MQTKIDVTKATPTWTGLGIVQDIEVRKTGKKVWVFEYLHGQDELFATDDPEVASEHLNRNEWDAHLFMVADTLEDAKERFYCAQDQHSAWVNGVEDWVNVVYTSVGFRPEVGPLKRYGDNGDHYHNWVREYRTRYGVEVS